MTESTQDDRSLQRLVGPTVAVLCVAAKSVYRSIPNVECYDLRRDVRTFTGGMPVVAHPPCRSWSAYCAHQAKPLPGEKELGPLCVKWLRECGGVLEHPAHSRLFDATGLPKPGEAIRGNRRPVDTRDEYAEPHNMTNRTRSAFFLRNRKARRQGQEAPRESGRTRAAHAAVPPAGAWPARHQVGRGGVGPVSIRARFRSGGRHKHGLVMQVTENNLLVYSKRNGGMHSVRPEDVRRIL